jgi:hypothetical protein
MPPLWQYFSRVAKKGADEAIFAPKGSGIPHREGHFPANECFLRVRKWVPWVPIMDPQRCRRPPSRLRSWSRRSCPRCGSTWRGVRKADEARPSIPRVTLRSRLRNGSPTTQPARPRELGDLAESPRALDRLRRLGPEGNAPAGRALRDCPTAAQAREPSLSPRRRGESRRSRCDGPTPGP